MSNPLAQLNFAYFSGAVALLAAVFACGYGMGVATRILTGLLRLGLLIALVGALGWGAVHMLHRQQAKQATTPAAPAAKGRAAR